MSDLDGQEREALEKDRPPISAFGGAIAHSAYYKGWMAARDYYRAALAVREEPPSSILMGITEHLAEEHDLFGRASDLLTAVKAICDEPLDERPGKGPTRHGQFLRIDALLEGLPKLPGEPADAKAWARNHLKSLCVAAREAWIAERSTVEKERDELRAKLAAREEAQDLGEPDAALVWRAARAMWEAGPTTSRRGWEDLSDRQREFAYNEARAAVGVVFVAVREADYDPDRDKRPYSELSETQRIARERASLKRQLDAVDRELKWAGTGRGRIQSIRLLSAREAKEPSVAASLNREVDTERPDGLLDRLASLGRVTVWSNPHDVGRWCVETNGRSYWGDNSRAVLENALAGAQDTEQEQSR
jgi:hypothetical protein